MINSSMSSVGQAQMAHRQLESQNAQNFKSLASSLQSGHLAGAQKAFQALQATAPKNQNSTVSADSSALGQALQSGDLGAAQTAFANIQQQMKAHKGHHAHSGSEPKPAQDPDGDGDGTSTISISA